MSNESDQPEYIPIDLSIEHEQFIALFKPAISDFMRAQFLHSKVVTVFCHKIVGPLTEGLSPDVKNDILVEFVKVGRSASGLHKASENLILSLGTDAYIVPPDR